MNELIGLKLKDIADGRIVKGFIFETKEGKLIGFRVPKDQIEEVDFTKHEEEDNWNLADNIIKGDRTVIKKENHKYVDAALVADIKTFIQKTKEDLSKLYTEQDTFLTKQDQAKIEFILEKRAGNL